MAKAESAFQDWVVKNGGPVNVASILDVTPFAVRHWVNRKGWPKVKTILEIIELSGGKLTFETIVDSCKPAPKRKAR